MTKVTQIKKIIINGSQDTLQPSSSVIGDLIGVNELGQPLVQFEQNVSFSAIPALSTLDGSEAIDVSALPIKVMLMFDNGRLNQPIITGLVKTTLLLKKQIDEKQAYPDVLEKNKNSLYTEVDGKKITLNGEEEILLKCGKSSILLRRDGKIIIKGSNLISRSSSSNKIKGASVNIN